MQDILNILLETEVCDMPVFMARDLSNLPPLSFNHFDISKVMRQLEAMRNELDLVKHHIADSNRCTNGNYAPLTTPIAESNTNKDAYDTIYEPVLQHSGPAVATPQKQCSDMTMKKPYKNSTKADNSSVNANTSIKQLNATSKSVPETGNSTSVKTFASVVTDTPGDGNKWTKVGVKKRRILQGALKTVCSIETEKTQW